MDDGKIMFYVVRPFDDLIPGGKAVSIKEKPLVMCKNCFRHETERCPFEFSTSCFRPNDEFFCAFGEVKDHG